MPKLQRTTSPLSRPKTVQSRECSEGMGRADPRKGDVSDGSGLDCVEDNQSPVEHWNKFQSMLYLEPVGCEVTCGT